ncbi:class I SAM-dependent methyltransferase, partial [Streptomyces albidoflavus]
MLDIGCGDGRVLVEAAKQGATCWGIEIDATLAEQARAALVPFSQDAGVITANFFDVDLRSIDPDITIAYLSRATLQALKLKLSRELRSGATLITLGVPVAGWSADMSDPFLYTYQMPPQDSPVPAEGSWPAAGYLFGIPPNTPCVTSIEVIHDPGAIRFALSERLSEFAAISVGTSMAMRREYVAVDITWNPQPAGTSIRGHIAGAG